MKIVAIMNDNTGKIHAVLKGYEHRFPFDGWIQADDITCYPHPLDHKTIFKIRYNGFMHEITENNYSEFYEEDEE